MISDHVFDPKATSIPVLRYLVALGDHRHFGRAAKACHVSQPTLSALLSRWEARMRIRVFERDPHGVRITAVGERVVQAARAALLALRQVEESAAAAIPPFFGPVRVGVIPTVGPYLMPAIAASLEATHPNLELPIMESTHADLLLALDGGRIDIALVALAPGFDQRWQCQRLYREPFLLAVPRGHRLSKRRTASPEDLVGERLLLLVEGHCLRDQALALCATVPDHPLGADYRATSLETLRLIVASGSGVTILPALACSQYADPRVSSIVMTGPGTDRTVVMLSRLRDGRSAAYALLGSAIRAALPRLVVSLEP